MRKNILFLVLALLCLNFSSKGQGKTTDSLSFKIGDQLPETGSALKPGAAIIVHDECESMFICEA
jgi:hypothetical protein